MIHFSLCFFFFVAFSCLAAEQTRLPLNDYFAETWNTRSGLPHNSINSVAQTNDGYVWIATWEGLARFNGREFKLFTRSEIPDLPDSGLRSLAPQADGSLYISGARGGVSHLKNRQWLVQNNASAMVNYVLKTRSGEMWLALEGDGIAYRDYDNGPEHTILVNLSAYRLVEDKRGVIWAATSDGLYKIENKIAQLVTPSSGLPHSSIYSALLTQQGQLIVAGEKGAWRLVGDMFESIHPKLDGESISSLLQDDHDDIWFGTINKGLFRLSEIGLEQLDADSGLPANRILSLMQDREKSIWVGTNGGVYRLREAPFSSWTKKRGLNGDYVRSVLSHSDGSMWVGSSLGLNRVNNDSVVAIPPAFEQGPLSILSLAEDNQGGVWVGTYTSGLMRVVDKKIYPVINRDNGLLSNEIRALLFDNEQRLWVGSAAGLTRIDPDGSVVQYTTEQGLPGDFIMALALDSRGNIWVGTGVGVAMFNGELEKFKGQAFPKQFNAEYAFGFYAQQNFMWMTTDRGLIRFNIITGEIAILGREQGLPVDKLFQLVVQDDSFWLSSNRGIIQVKQQQVNELLNDPSSIKGQKLQYQLYDEGDGMLSAQANGGSNPAATLHNDGSIWFATSQGASTVVPERIKQASQISLPTVIESLYVDGKNTPILYDEELVLPPSTARLSFHYAGLSFIMPQRLNFQTKLIGYNNEWVNRQRLTITEYTNLAPGKYTFMVRAGYPNGQWQDNYKTINFVIQSYFWQQTGFKLVMFFTLLLLAFGLYQYRLYHYKKIEKELIIRVEQQTRDLQQQTDAFAHQATHDQLTDLPNRRAFDSWLAENFSDFKQQALPLAIAIMDIDHFKRINDGWSHIIGDRVICVVAHLLSQCVKSDASEVARWGGEEFTLLFPNKTAQQAAELCDELRLEIANYDFSTIANGLSVTVSFGVADSLTVNDYDRLLAQADQALYKAKTIGRNRVEIIFSDTLSAEQPES
ncbi:ligand-binding sensor domain-containing diguanylate cyclase [Pseudoalteromonas sp. KAN5]|uniref:ligand-binding sensor domain-containing protein n=1 Tax=Pseudoalteromonas sp. KAN5 TaxID=2916633 RepID=UPI001FCCBD1D|nr:ligand-binding sensor domain-containing diguanylate cyclase [Pseudoalteromonas sp. KAN5]BDF93905.1 GGDEF domain-containing protein [Pseudoalteromonas sp. KAN5]